MAGYNPLSYFSFGKKKDATSTSATPAPSGRGREGAHASSRGASRAHSEAVAPSPRGRAEAHHEEAEEHEPFLKVTKGNPTEEELAALTAVVAAMQVNAAHQEQNTLVGAASRILNRRQHLGASLRAPCRLSLRFRLVPADCRKTRRESFIFGLLYRSSTVFTAKYR